MEQTTNHVHLKLLDVTLIDEELARCEQKREEEGQRSDRLEAYWKAKIENLQWIKENLVSVVPHIEQAWQAAGDLERFPETDNGGASWYDTYRPKVSMEDYIREHYGEEATVPA
jgi:hypothetical protein